MATPGSAGYSSQQPAQYMPSMQNIPITTRTWLTTGNTDTVIDAAVHPGSFIAITNTALPNGLSWRVVVSQGSFVVTSSDSENAGMTYNYRLL